MSVPFDTLRREQWIPKPIEEVFAFFVDAYNLEQITPPWLNFRMLSLDSQPVRKGTLIRYRLRLHGLPIYWRTEIRQWRAPNRFVDVQRIGPYRLWHHTHVFQAHGDRTKMIDVVRYKLPLGFFGRLIHELKVRGDLQKIFEYRRHKIQAILCGTERPNS
jgi:ligand-binding SRPBCC domain-containing protein